MSLKEAIRFRYLANQWSQAEEQRFILQLFKESHEIIYKALFNHFIDDKNDAKSVNGKISTIIRARDNPTDNEPIQHRLDMIVRPLIGHIGSFLDQMQQINIFRL